MSAPKCRVCRRRTAEYTCPRCNARYCSVECYRDHSERCTEGFYRDAAVSELRSITAGQDERQRMVDILQRLHQQDIEGGSSEEGGGDDEEDKEEEGLSNATLHLLLAKMQAAGGVLDVCEQDLTPAELAAFHRALAAGELSAGLQPWQPWWLSEEAMQLELGAAGTPLMAAVAGQEATQEQQQAHGASEAAAASTVLPAPPSRPLPPLVALTRAPPSPLLQYQLLDLLYAYCHTLRLYNGEPLCDAEAAADALFALSAVLAAVVQAPAAGGGSASDSAAVAPVLLACLQRACQPPVGGQDSRGFAIGIVSDVAAVLRLGRPVVLTALMDLSRLLEAARQQLEGGSGQADSGGGGSKQQRKELRRQLVAAERKLLFFLAWANEQPPEAYEHLAAAAAAEQQKHAAAAVATPGQRPEGAAQPGLMDLSGGTRGDSRGGTLAAGAVLIEELP